MDIHTKPRTHCSSAKPLRRRLILFRSLCLGLDQKELDNVIYGQRCRGHTEGWHELLAGSMHTAHHLHGVTDSLMCSVLRSSLTNTKILSWHNALPPHCDGPKFVYPLQNSQLLGGTYLVALSGGHASTQRLERLACVACKLCLRMCADASSFIVILYLGLYPVDIHMMPALLAAGPSAVTEFTQVFSTGDCLEPLAPAFNS